VVAFGKLVNNPNKKTTFAQPDYFTCSNSQQACALKKLQHSLLNPRNGEITGNLQQERKRKIKA
jgi:hypothetical protein